MLYPDAEVPLGFLVADTSRLMRRHFHRRLGELGLSLAQGRALAVLALEEGIKQVTLADKLEIQPMTVARLVDGLQEMGMVERRADPTDRRAFRIHLTAEGTALAKKVWPLVVEAGNMAITGFTEKAAADFYAALTKIKNNLQAMESDEAAERKAAS